MRRDASPKGGAPPPRMSKKFQFDAILLRREATASLHIIASLHIFGIYPHPVSFLNDKTSTHYSYLRTAQKDIKFSAMPFKKGILSQALSDPFDSESVLSLHCNLFIKILFTLCAEKGLIYRFSLSPPTVNSTH